MKRKKWIVQQDEESYEITVNYAGSGRRLSVCVNGETFKLPNVAFTGLRGRRENLKIGDRLGILVIKPFGFCDIVVGGRFYSSGKPYRH